MCTYFIDVINNRIHDFALERLVNDRAVTRDELGLSASNENHALSNVNDVDHSNDVAEFARTCT